MTFIRNSKNQKVKNAVKVVDNLRNGPRRLDRASNDIDEILESKSISSNHSQDIKISFIHNNKTYQYEFELTENGYSLK